jgi:hypothetical protein
MLEAPQGRYKIIERDNRLITIDTQTGAEIAGGATPIAPAPRPLQPAVRTQPFASALPTAPAQPGKQSSPLATKPGSPAANLAALTDLTKPDAQGRVTIPTLRWFDPKAPRRIRLTAENTRKLGQYLRFGLGAAVFALFLAAIVSPVFAVFFAGFCWFKGRKLATGLILRLLEGGEEVG